MAIETFGVERQQHSRQSWLDCRNIEDEKRWELIDGQLYAMSSPSLLHQIISRQLVIQLAPFFAGGPCQLLFAPLDVKLSEHDLVQPDLLVVCNPDQLRPNYVEGPPQLIIEILSPSTHRHDRVRKLNLYGRAGVAEYWLVTPHLPLVEVLLNGKGLFTTVAACTERDTLRSPSFPQLQLDLSTVFANLPEQPPIDEVRESTPHDYAVREPAGPVTPGS